MGSCPRSDGPVIVDKRPLSRSHLPHEGVTEARHAGNLLCWTCMMCQLFSELIDI